MHEHRWRISDEMKCATPVDPYIHSDGCEWIHAKDCNEYYYYAPQEVDDATPEAVAADLQRLVKAGHVGMQMLQQTAKNGGTMIHYWMCRNLQPPNGEMHACSPYSNYLRQPKRCPDYLATEASVARVVGSKISLCTQGKIHGERLRSLRVLLSVF